MTASPAPAGVSTMSILESKPFQIKVTKSTSGMALALSCSFRNAIIYVAIVLVLSCMQIERD